LNERENNVNLNQTKTKLLWVLKAFKEKEMNLKERMKNKF
jgi:hypothetical protein